MSYDRQWWQDFSIEEFCEELKTMDIDEIGGLQHELSGAISVANLHASDSGRPMEKRASARRAMAYMSQKKKAILTELAGRRSGMRNETLNQAESVLNDGDVRGAVSLLIKMLRGPV
jgi:hypothetical protein